jgi:hypothetical protein
MSANNKKISVKYTFDDGVVYVRLIPIAREFRIKAYTEAKLKNTDIPATKIDLSSSTSSKLALSTLK